jgi:hypothetical protein
MKQFIFSHKDIKGGVPVVLEIIKKELGEMIKHLGCPLEEVENKLATLEQEYKSLLISQRKTPADEKLKEKIEKTKTMIKSASLVISVK